MRKLIFGLSFCFLSLSLFSQELKSEVSTYYLIRHAEKEISDNPDPDLTDVGIARAENWARIFKNVKFDAIYSTDYKRTKATVEPTAFNQNLKILWYHPSQIDIKQFLKETEGKTVLIVGHSNTIPSFVNHLIGQNKYGDIEDSNNANLYIVEISNTSITDKLLYIK